MNTMKTQFVKVIATLGMLAIGLVFAAQEARAEISTNNVTALTITITPNADRGVEISSANSSLDLGSVDMSFSTKTVFPATVTIMGNMATSELTLQSTISAAGLDSWNFDDDPTAADQDLLAVWSLFSNVNITSAPEDNEFVIYNATVTQAMVAAAAQVGDTTRFEGGWTGSNMDDMAAGSRRHLWTRMRTPSSTSRTATQNVVFTLTVQSAN